MVSPGILVLALLIVTYGALVHGGWFHVVLCIVLIIPIHPQLMFALFVLFNALF